MNLKDTLESLIQEAIEDEQELIPTDQLPSALLIADRIRALEWALHNIQENLKEITYTGPAYPAKIASKCMAIAQDVLK